MNYEGQSKLIRDFVLALKALRAGGLTSNTTSLTCQLSEWLVKEIFDGVLAPTSINKDWDVISNGKRIQVKAHAKDSTNKNRHTRINSNEAAAIDELIIIVFSEHYVIKDFYIVPWNYAVGIISHNKGGSILSWSQIHEFRVDVALLPNQEVVSLFRS